MSALVEQYEELASPPVQLLTVEETRRMLGLGKTTVYGFLKSGELPSVMFGRTRRVDVDDIRAFIARQKAAQAA